MRNCALRFAPFFRRVGAVLAIHVWRGLLFRWNELRSRNSKEETKCFANVKKTWIENYAFKRKKKKKKVVMSLFYSPYNGRHQLACWPKQGSWQLKTVTLVREKQPRTGHFHKVLLQAGCPSFRENLYFKTLFSRFSEKYYTLASLTKAAQDNTPFWKEDNVSLSTEIATRTASLNLKNVSIHRLPPITTNMFAQISNSHLYIFLSFGYA